MNCLLVDTYSKGHHLSYVTSLAEECSEYGNAVVLMPGDAETAICAINNVHFELIAKDGYLNLLKQIKVLVKKYNIDIVHFVYADAFMKYFGLGIAGLKCSVVATFHQIRNSFLRDFSRKCFFKSIDCGVVHTDYILKNLCNSGIKNVIHIEYPYFQTVKQIEQSTARAELGIPQDVPVFLALGGTRYDKGLDILLHALQKVEQPFFLLVAGKEMSFKKTDIEQMAQAYTDRIKLIMKFLSDEEFRMCLSACDFVVLPYRKSFDGASGPLGEGVAYSKTVIASNHGSLGVLVNKNHLGYTFESEDIQQLADTITSAVLKGHVKDDVYLAYQKELNPKCFQQMYVECYNNVLSSNN